MNGNQALIEQLREEKNKAEIEANGANLELQKVREEVKGIREELRLQQDRR